MGFSFLHERLDPVGLSPVRTAHPQERARGAAARRAVPDGSGTGPVGAKGKEMWLFPIGNESSAWERSHRTWRGAPEGQAWRPLPPSAGHRSPVLPENSYFLRGRHPPSARQEGWGPPRWPARTPQVSWTFDGCGVGCCGVGCWVLVLSPLVLILPCVR